MSNHGEDCKCTVCGMEGNTAHDLTWSERLSAWVHGDHCDDIALLSTTELRQMCRYMLRTAAHQDTKQWMRNGIEAIFASTVKRARLRLEKRLGRGKV